MEEGQLMVPKEACWAGKGQVFVE